MKLLMILQSPLSQQSQKLQDHVLKISRYCWPSRARLQPGPYLAWDFPPAAAPAYGSSGLCSFACVEP